MPSSKLEELIYEERKTAKHAKLGKGAGNEDRLTAYKYLKDVAIEETAVIQDKMGLISNNTKEAQLQNSFRKFFLAEKCNSYFKG